MGKFKIVKKAKPVMEDDANNNNHQQQQNASVAQPVSVDPKTKPLEDQLNQLLDQERKLDSDYYDNKKKITDQKQQLTDKIQAIKKSEQQNESSSVNESVSYGKRKELAELIRDAFTNVEDKMSYTPTVDEINRGFFDNIARGLLRYINSHGWSVADGVDRSAEIADALMSYFKHTSVNYSEREIEHLYLALIDVLKRTDNSFSWLVK
jgi:small-conductance mechanosensitive channel